MRTPFLHLLLVISAGWVGCSSSRAPLDNGNRELGGPDAGNGVDAGCVGHVCSRDLRSIRTCSGDLVRECDADKACGNGECVAPCAAAAINQGSLGCSFAVPFPIAYGTSCYAFFIANTWTSPATIRLDFKGQNQAVADVLWEPYLEDGLVKHRKLAGPIPPGGGAVVFLSNELSDFPYWTSCPVGIKPVFTRSQALRGTGVTNAVLASADVPVSMYAIFPYGGAKSYFPSGTLLLPTTSFRTNYIVTSSWGGNGDGFGQGLFPNGNQTPQIGSPSLQIVAIEDETEVRLLPKVDIAGGRTVSASPANTVARYQLKRGEILQLIQQAELTGSALESSKPVGVFGGHTDLMVPRGNGFADVDNKQLPPLSVWGHEYAVLPAPNRARLVGTGGDVANDPSVIRIVGAAEGTVLSYEPRKPEGAPPIITTGELARFFAGEPFVVRSQDAEHPFYVATVMTGSSTMKAGIGDPETAIAIPSDQWLDTYGFFSDYTYARSAIVVTRRRTNGAFYDVTLDCAGVLTGWESITPDYEWATLQLTRAGRPQTYPAGQCSDGAHRIRSDGPFSLTVWGVSTDASYSYPGGMGLRTSTPFEVPVH